MDDHSTETRFTRIVASGELNHSFVVQCVQNANRQPNPAVEKWVVGLSAGAAALIILAIFLATGWLKTTAKLRAMIHIFGTAIVAGVVQAYYRNWHASRFPEGSCRKCGYSLRDLPSAETVTIGKVRRPLGPAVCPECGQAWPFIFPQ